MSKTCRCFFTSSLQRIHYASFAVSIACRMCGDRHGASLYVPMSGASSLIDNPEDWKPGKDDLSKYNPTSEDIVDKATAPGRIIYF